jgi:hypothetical protein
MPSTPPKTISIGLFVEHSRKETDFVDVFPTKKNLYHPTGEEALPSGVLFGI